MAINKVFRVLVASDGSASAKAAVTTVLGFPWPARTRVQGVTASLVPQNYRQAVVLAALGRTAQAIAASARRTLSRRWPEAEVTVVSTPPVTAVLQAAARFDADVIVLGWRGHGAVRRFLVGSVSRGVVRDAKCAVLVVRRRQREVRRIVVGVDGSANAQRAVGLLNRLPAPRGGHVTLVSAVDHMEVPSHPLAPRAAAATLVAEVKRINADSMAQAEKALASAKAMLARAGWQVRTRVTVGAPLRELLAIVDSADAELLVVGARGVGGMRRLLLGSVAEGALNRCPVPVLVVR